MTWLREHGGLVDLAGYVLERSQLAGNLKEMWPHVGGTSSMRLVERDAFVKQRAFRCREVRAQPFCLDAGGKGQVNDMSCKVGLCWGISSSYQAPPMPRPLSHLLAVTACYIDEVGEYKRCSAKRLTTISYRSVFVLRVNMIALIKLI